VTPYFAVLMVCPRRVSFPRSSNRDRRSSDEAEQPIVVFLQLDQNDARDQVR
jgi:hypothetical protein